MQVDKMVEGFGRHADGHRRVLGVIDCCVAQEVIVVYRLRQPGVHPDVIIVTRRWVAIRRGA